VKIRLIPATVVAMLTLAGCAKDINNKEAVRVAVVDYLTKRAESTGLNVAKMEVQIGSVSFQKDQAQAVVSIKPIGGADGMQMSYALVRKGDAWEVKGKQESGPNPHGGGAEIPSPGAAGGEVPPGHPPVDPSKAGPGASK
jgi:hypothetical protein